ncbi:hypothetical protein CBQ28_15910 [Pseudoalteromonas sp. GCY]|nr:hypothetical protein CBQ28_15910 [Pseudoalteromonas sp. GCY]
MRCNPLKWNVSFQIKNLTSAEKCLKKQIFQFFISIGQEFTRIAKILFNILYVFLVGQLFLEYDLVNCENPL